MPSLKLTARPWKSPSFLVNTIKMVDFPASYVSFREGISPTILRWWVLQSIHPPFRFLSRREAANSSHQNKENHLNQTSIVRFQPFVLQRVKWMFPKIGVPQNGWFFSWKTLLIKMDDLGVPLFLETPKCTFWCSYFFSNPILPVDTPRKLTWLAGKSPCWIGVTSWFMIVFFHCHLSFLWLVNQPPPNVPPQK